MHVFYTQNDLKFGNGVFSGRRKSRGSETKLQPPINAKRLTNRPEPQMTPRTNTRHAMILDSLLPMRNLWPSDFGSNWNLEMLVF